MGTAIVITAPMWEQLRAHLIRVSPDNPHPPEEMAFLLATVNESAFGLRLLVREMMLAKPEDLLRREQGGIEPTPEFVARMLDRCTEVDWSLIEIHSHPFDRSMLTTFSRIDWDNEKRKMPFLAARFNYRSFKHATAVVGQAGLDAHLYEPETDTILPIEEIVVVGEYQGRSLTRIATTSNSYASEQPVDFLPQERHQRQTLFFGKETQQILGQTTIAIAGLGGIGGFVTLQLAHLGIGHLILIDPDRVEETNLNRLLGVGSSNIGQLKVEAYRQLIARIAPNVRVTALPIDVYSETGIYYAKGADVLIGCVDNHGARLILNQIATRNLIPFIDAGTGIRLASATQKALAGGQVQVVLPGEGSCLACRGMIDYKRAAFDLATPEEQAYERLHGYGSEEVAPSVISLNGVIASLLLTEVLFLLAGQAIAQGQEADVILYNALGREVSTGMFAPIPGCPTCSQDGMLGVGDLVPIQPPQRSSRAPGTPAQEEKSAVFIVPQCCIRYIVKKRAGRFIPAHGKERINHGKTTTS